MIEVKGSLWDYETDAIVITTNGTIKNNGEVVMGRGCASEAKQRFPTWPKALGDTIQELGNRVFSFGGYGDKYLYSFPVKHNWWEKADLELIEESCKQLIYAADTYKDDIIVVPRPGCGNGGRDWESEVKPILERYFDDRFHVITF